MNNLSYFRKRLQEERKNNSRAKRGGSVDTTNVSDNGIFPRDKHGSFNNLWRPSSLMNLVNPLRRQNSGSVYDSSPTDDASVCSNEPVKEDTAIVAAKASDLDVDKLHTQVTLKKLKPISEKRKSDSWGTLVTIVLVEAKGLPDAPNDGTSHGLYCKIRLGSQSQKSKTVQNLRRPVWRERFQFYILKDKVMKISLCDKGKQKTFMGSCSLDLSNFDKERTHEIWQQLDNGFGSLHMSVTICNVRKINVDNDVVDKSQLQNRHENFNSTSDLRLVGQLYVKVVSGKGMSGKFSAYCTLEVDNERVRTHSARGTEPTWDKSFIFNVYDATSTLDLKVYEASLMTPLHNESSGRVSVPLLRIRNGEAKWFALKDKNKRHIAKASCPRVLLEMSFYYNPIKASLRLFRPKEVKYIKKPPKFDIALVYKNLEFIKDIIIFLCELNESYKRLFEWDNRELSFVALSGWLIFWYNFKMWAAPLLLLIPFFYFWLCNRNHLEKSFMRGYGIVKSEKEDKSKPERSLTGRLTQLPDMTLTITDAIDYIASLSEKFYNLASFKVPFLSYLTMLLLVVASAGLYLIPFHCIMMALGIYKFSRKILKPDRVLNNDLEDFLSRIPDTEILNDWKELNVPEPTPINGIKVANKPYTVKDTVMY